MRRCRQNPTRLAELPPENDLVGVALLIQSARQAPDEPLPLVKWRIRNSLRRRSEWNRRGLRLVLVVALVFFAGSVVGAIAVPLLGSRLRSTPPKRAEPHPSSQAVRHSHSRVSAQAIPLAPTDQPIVPAEPAVTPAPAVPSENNPAAVSDTATTAKAVLAPVAPMTAVAKPSNVASMRPSTVAGRTRLALAQPAALQPPVGASSPLAPGTSISTTRIALRDAPIAPASQQNPPSESRLGFASPTGSSQKLPALPATVDLPTPRSDERSLLSAAVRRLRATHDPASALTALDDYRMRFPGGVLAPEAAMLRAEALLQIGRKGDALVELDGLSLAQMPNSDEHHVLRGELRAAVGRWREALADFDIVLRSHAGESADIVAPTDVKARGRLERALWGRALARSRLGDNAGARADLQECLRRFPGGRFASEATRLLGEQR
jgi:TolA-binding protein